MSRKTRRTKAKHRARPAKSMQERQPQQLKPLAPLAAKTQVPAKMPLQAQAPRYQYIMPELRYIGILAGAIIVILIVLSFVLG
jgi:hypothetical protein